MKRFEYKAFNEQLHERELCSLGDEGWELVIHTFAVTGSVFGTSQGQYYVFKREKQDVSL